LDFTSSNSLSEKFHSVIPGGSHTYAKGDDQYPEFIHPYIVRGEGCHVWDVDGNEFIEYNMGIRAVSLGHAYPAVVEAAYRQMKMGTNFVRPGKIELDCAEQFLGMIKGAEMVKFSKNGSDATNGAVKLSRAYTGRDMVAICGSHPFFSVDDWFIGSTPMSAGIPKVVQDLTVKFKYNDIESAQALFDQYPNRIACVILEPEKEQEPQNGFLHKLQDLCRVNGAVLILDEMITGFRWHNSGAQYLHGITPDLCTFGKALGNGFSVSALAGKRELMRLGGLEHDKERVFLMSGTHGAETHGLAAAMATMKIYETEPVVDTLWRQGARLASGLQEVIDQRGLSEHIPIMGRPCCLVYGTRDEELKPSQPFRTLLLQETLKRGVMAPSLVVSYSHNDTDIDRTIEAFDQAFKVYRKALDEGVDKYLVGRSVQPVWRRFNK
jgi:glutamate-1-semialdehyde 2,1-aminomutase